MVVEKSGREFKVQEVRELKDGDILKAFGEVKAVVRGSVRNFVEKVQVKELGKECEVRGIVRKLVEGDEVICIGRIFEEEIGGQMRSGGKSVREPKEGIVSGGFGGQEDLSIREVMVVEEAVVIKVAARKRALCRNVVAESGVKFGEQGDPGSGDRLHYGEGQES